MGNPLNGVSGPNANRSPGFTAKASARPHEDFRLEIIDWLKAWAILAVILDHLKIVPEPFVIWSVNIFVLVTAAVYSIPGYVFSLKKLASKFFHLAYLYVLSVFFVDLVFGLIHEKINRPVLSILLNPFYIFIQNPYLGDIWYLSLHVQILTVFYLFLKYKNKIRARYVFLIAALISPSSFWVTHFYLERLETILVTSWLLFLAVGFYGMRPLLIKIRSSERHRFFGFLLGAGILALVYACYPFVPWLFQNENRSTFLTLPLYFGLILFLSEGFYLSGGFPIGKFFTQGMSFCGRYTLAIYLTHQAFAFLWSKVFDAPLLLAALTVVSGIFWGMITDRVYTLLNTTAKRAFVRISWVSAR